MLTGFARWDEKDRKRVLLGYLVSRQVQVELRDLELLGTLLERAVDAGVNQVNDPVLDSSRRKQLEREAMAKAEKAIRMRIRAACFGIQFTIFRSTRTRVWPITA